MPARREDGAAVDREPARYAASAPSRNLTLDAIADADLADVDRDRAVAQVPFSSRRRWSALDPEDERLVLGAPERVGDQGEDARHARCQRLSLRVVAKHDASWRRQAQRERDQR